MALGLQEFALAIWFGGGLATLVATRTIFSAVDPRARAGQVAGAVVRNFRWLQLGGVAIWAAALATARLVEPAPPRGFWVKSAMVVLLLAAALPGDARLHRLRGDQSEGARERFRSLHGISMALLAGQIVAAANGLVSQ